MCYGSKDLEFEVLGFGKEIEKVDAKNADTGVGSNDKDYQESVSEIEIGNDKVLNVWVEDLVLPDNTNEESIASWKKRLSPF